jgi:hypothetical protein
LECMNFMVEKFCSDEALEAAMNNSLNTIFHSSGHGLPSSFQNSNGVLSPFSRALCLNEHFSKHDSFSSLTVHVNDSSSLYNNVCLLAFNSLLSSDSGIF